MITDKLFWDIETLPTVDPDIIADITAGVTHPATMKKADTIEKWMLEERPGAIEEAIRKTSLDGGTGRLASICWAKADGEIVGSHTAGDHGWDIDIERALISGFFKEADAFYKEVAGAVLTGHNIINFDLRWLWKRAIVLGIPVPHWWPLNARAWSPEVADTMAMWEGANKFISQDRLGRILGLGGKSDIDGSMVAEIWDAGEYDRVLEYNADDVSKCRRMWARITQHDGPIEPAVEAPVVVEEKPVEVMESARFLDDDEIAEEEAAVAEVAIAAAVEEKPAKETAADILKAGIRASVRPGAPLPFDTVVRAQKTKTGAAGVVVLFDGREGTIEVERMKADPDAWHVRWLDVGGGGISFEGGRWVRVPDDVEVAEDIDLLVGSGPVGIDATVKEKPKQKGRVIPAFLRERGLAA